MNTTKTRKAFGKRVRELRTAKGYSQEAFADVVGLHRTYIGAIERGEQNVSIDNIDRIAKTLKIPISRLFEGL
jgi:transcriptional regulator with XRE-family HTH domain